MSKPSIPQGTRDFDATVLRKRNYIFSAIKNVFEKYAFEPLETPAMENLDTLMGKYGEEGDRLIFKILNNGLSDPKNIDKAKIGFEKLLEGKSSNELTERALKYDLTIPFARYVAMNIGKLTFPYKRYQIQPVWRADRPQKGRYREFTQCDADIVGSHSLLIEVELANIYHEAFVQLGIKNYELKINSRKILSALAKLCGGADKMTDITVAIDKIDKIGIDKVKIELSERGLTQEQIDTVEKYLNISGSNDEKIAQAIALFGDSAEANRGLEEITNVVKKATDANITVDFSLARGLNYYTGIIFEAKAPAEVSIGSIGGGGRYDDLTSLFGVKESMPGVGISFGVDRIYDVMEELNLFPENIGKSVKAIFFNMGEQEANFSFGIMQQLRSKGIACELFYESAKISKQFSYAEKKNIEYAVIIGSKEIEQNYCQVKQLATGVQELVILDNLFDYLSTK
ncbi:histidine--tRNA ligase [Ferruginibacter lapsinanis]|uniref:histidine--tRNA ligase n=1 Tax=Ferruginibacter lapsinanis TaxID=563172 RepID=UPI001E44E19E|nr:histidine--tRNA ligase [Ferruginibacter lapsinanis]UEG50026.1 histidine--tRNA ligase [Ferruginibacter lapsinanis]